MKGILYLFTTIFCSSSLMQGGGPETPYEYLVAGSRSGSSRFLIVTPVYNNEKPENTSGNGRCYMIDDGGKLKIMWKISGWYAFPRSLYLTGDGFGLVRVHDIEWGPDIEPKHKRELDENDILLSFYYKGKLVRHFKLSDLFTKLDFGRAGQSDRYSIICDVNFIPLRFLKGRFANLDLVLSENEEMFDKVVSITTVQQEELFFKVTDGTLLYRHPCDLIGETIKPPADQ